MRALLRVAKEWSRPILAAFLLCGLVISVGPSDATDRRMSDKLLAGQHHTADQNIVIIEINGADLRQYGRPMLSRESLGRLINVIADAKPRRLMVDLYLGEAIEPSADTKLQRALSRLGPDRLGLVTSPGPDDLPYAPFRKFASVLDARLTSDSDGWHRILGSEDRFFGNNPAFWLATGDLKNGPVTLDLRIAHTEYPRYSVGDVFSGAADLNGKTIILGANPIVAPTRAYLPQSPSASRGAVLAVATQSAATDYAATIEDGRYASLFLQFLAIALGFLVALKADTGKKMVFLAVGFSLTLLLANLSIATALGASISPTKTLACFLVMMNVTVVQRLNIVPMVSSFIKGDISPEEAWAWRSCETSSHPAVLFSANGRIKRNNTAAEALVAEHGAEIVRLCLPRFDQRAEKLVLPANDSQYFDVDWPYGEVPIAVLRDNTESEQVNRTLREQLYTDELTGCTNRRGFDKKLSEAAKSDQAYILFFIDMNGFKQINDTFGHDAGDELLVASTSRLQNLMRASDVLARLGGDEFGVIMFGSDNSRFAKLQERRMADALSQPIRLTSTDHIVTVSAAIGHAMPDNAEEDIGEVLRRADQAMYRNKTELKRQRDAA